MNTKELKNSIISQIEKAFELAYSQKPSKIELSFPPDVCWGDFAVDFFGEAKNLGVSPAEVAKKVEASFKSGDLVFKAKAAGPYLNIKVSKEKLFGAVISEIENKKDKFGDREDKSGKRIMVEYLSPNTNKPLHLGHMRNGAIGMALGNILKSQGQEVLMANLINDRGIHIAKSMLAYQKWGEGDTPKKAKMKGDHFVGKYYVKFSQELEKKPELEKEAREMLEKWEAGDKETLALWRTMNDWVYAGFEETYKKAGFEFDEIFYESETYKLGKDIVEEGLKKNIFKKDESGAIIFDLSEKEFGLDRDGKPRKATIMRAGGTSLYITQDLGTAVTRAEKYKLEKLIYVVGEEQVFHFKVLFKILESLGYDWAKNLHHLSYGMVNLPSGKMKSRQGEVVDADDLILEVKNLVLEETGKREEKISGEEKEERAKKIALGAIKFYLLRVNSNQTICFDPKESIDLNGFTGPYCQYAYARISGILRNAQEKNISEKADFSLLGNPEEIKLIQKLLGFPDELEKAGKELNPLRIANSVYEISKAFNQFYNAHKVLDSEVSARLELVKVAGEVIKKGLNLLGIEAIERM